MAILRKRSRTSEVDGLAARVRALAEAADECAGRVPAELVSEARRVAQQADRRLAISGGRTVVALAGATGSGKSSLFNALSGTDLARAGVMRPTTSEPLAVSWGSEPVDELLDWLQIRLRHTVPADAVPAEAGRAVGASASPAVIEPGSAAAGSIVGDPTLATRENVAVPAPTRGWGRWLSRGERSPDQPPAPDGLVLLDLPDHDSTEQSHRTEVDRMVQLVDVLVWVVDPQKYADAVLHDRYLRPLAGHAGVMILVLNQIDRLTPAARTSCQADLRRLLDSQGLTKTEIMAVSAETGEGLAALFNLLVARAADKQAAARRLAADVSMTAAMLAGAVEPRAGGTGSRQPGAGLSPQALSSVSRAMADAAGVEVVSDAVRSAWIVRGSAATGWPVLAWIGRLKPDPLRRLHLDRVPAVSGGSGKSQASSGKRRGRANDIDPTAVGRTSLPGVSGVQQARVDSAVRSLAAEAANGLPQGWVDAIRTAARSNAAQLPDALDRAVAQTDLDLQRRRGWWRMIAVLQWLLVGAVVVGLGWLASAFVLSYLQLPPLPPVTWWGLPAPTVLAVGGVLAGLLVGGLCRIGVVVGANRRQRAARTALRRSVAAVVKRLVVQPVQAELDRYGRAQTALTRAQNQ